MVSTKEHIVVTGVMFYSRTIWSKVTQIMEFIVTTIVKSGVLKTTHLMETQTLLMEFIIDWDTGQDLEITHFLTTQVRTCT